LSEDIIVLTMASKAKKNRKSKNKGKVASDGELSGIEGQAEAEEAPLFDLGYAPFVQPDMSGLAADVIYANYEDETQLATIQQMAARDLSEPYSVFTYRYFLLKWPELCICAYDKDDSKSDKRGAMIGTILCKLDPVDESDPSLGNKGYIGMLIVDKNFRKRGIGQRLSIMAMERMVAAGCEQIVLETEASNKGALSLYEKLGFMREEKLPKYYLSLADAFRLKLLVDKRYIKDMEGICE
jgi:N-alpha-acetyltransferase 30